MTTLIEQARAATLAYHRADLADKAATEKAILDKREQALRDARVWANEEMSKVAECIRIAASAGKNILFYMVAHFEEEVSTLTTDRTNALMTLVADEGFAVKRYADVTEPCGSDSLFYHTVHSTGLEISW